MDTLQALDQSRRLALTRETAKRFRETSRRHDENISFPFENFEALKEIGYPKLSIPKEYGGGGISVEELM